MARAIIAVAGSGKTTWLVRQALSCPPQQKVLITTFTNENVSTIQSYFFRECGFVPENVTILPWYTFQLTHLVRPYRAPFLKCRPDSLDFNVRAPRYAKKRTSAFYMCGNAVYKDRLADLVYETISADRRPIIRLKKIFDKIFIDEAQDIAGWDLDTTKLLIESGLEITLLGDPRQRTFSTTSEAKNGDMDIFAYFEKVIICT